MVDTIELNFQVAAQFVALGLEAVAITVLAIGAGEAAFKSIAGAVFHGTSRPALRAIWLRFAGWIILALEFALGADVIRTTVAPSWDDIGKLGAIAVIRTGLNYFLERDIEECESEIGDAARKR